ncbi:MAG: hypothetical protein PWR07_2067 [Bacillota bacterium]|nr:DUF951 domain-containing protein [Bacillota bacterium]MDK2931936.1 hypothetical protein [Bacillota bacterium]
MTRADPCGGGAGDGRRRRKPLKFYIGDVVRLKKQHPCGSYEWEVMRVGADFRIKCLGCGRVVMLSRPKFEKSVKQIVSQPGGEGGEV